ncbi:TIGR00341 family protein [Rubritalea sp.]|uniref:TIGR00341 family protein n=1 Tax=Rubritalea sp. TaxID=2109375 RepID=UPI003EF0F6A8
MSIIKAMSMMELFPSLSDDERVGLEEQLRDGSAWSVNFGVMLGCSVLLAGLGLLQDSVAVVIGAMLVAPLMTPLIAIGLGLVQGNYDLLRTALQSMWRGVVVGLVLGFLLRVLIPGSELTQQVASRGSANILDLFIAFFAGVAAAYALARPKMSGALPGVAIAVALVPPLTASGIALGSQDWSVALGAFILLLTNVVMIVLGSAMVFRLHGLKTKDLDHKVALSMKRIITGLVVLGVLGMAPLAYRLIDQVKIGQSRPASYPLPEELWSALYQRAEQEKGVDLIRGLRTGDFGIVEVKIFLLADRPVRQVLIDDLEKMVKNHMGADTQLTVRAAQSAPIISSTRVPREMPGIVR